MNVLQLISGRSATGAAAAALLDAKALSAATQRVYVVSRHSETLAQQCVNEKLEVIATLRRERSERLLALAYEARRLRALVREYDIDVVHVHRSDDQLLARLALGSQYTTRLIRSWHRDPRHLARALFERLTGRVDGCVCVARDHAETLRKAGVKNAAFIPPGVDTDLFRPAPKAAPPAIGQIGRWKNEKTGDRGQRAALEIFAQLPHSLDWQGLLLGRGEMKDALEKSVPDRVKLQDLTGIPPPEFARLVAGLSLGLVFKTGGDGTSRAAVEMLACGVPLLAADLPGLRELAEDAACALRLLPDDPGGWAKAIEKLLREPKRLREMSAAARQRTEKVHALAVRGAALAEFFRESR